MTNYDLYLIILQFLRKDRRGGVLNETEYQVELQRMNLLYLETTLPFYEKDQSITDKLGMFKKIVNGSLLGITAGNIPLPSDYVRHGYLHCSQDGTIPRVLDVLTDSQWSDRLSSSVSPPTERFPVCIYRDGVINFRPSDLTANYFEYSYIRRPVTPYFDGYFDADGNFIYLGEGESHVLLTNEVGLNGQDSGTYDSITIELEWFNEDKLAIADMILRRLGVPLKEPLVTQFNDAIIKERK